MLSEVFTSPFFGISISIVAYAIGVFLNKKTKSAFFNPLLISYMIIISILILFKIPLSSYNEGGDIINMFLSPATAVLAITIYRQKALIKDNLLPIIIGTLVGSTSSLLIVYFSCKLLHLDEVIISSLLPKSITTPLALSVSTASGGIGAITVLAVIVTGVSGNILAPLLIKLFHFNSEIVQGIAIGTSSHAVGTSKAIELGEKQGALSSVALTFSGIITVVLALIFF